MECKRYHIVLEKKKKEKKQRWIRTPEKWERQAALQPPKSNTDEDLTEVPALSLCPHNTYSI